MPDEFSKLPVEIWYEILQAVIHAPYVLDTTVPTEGCFWHQQDVYHNRQHYRESEEQRKLLRLVCKPWKEFADSNQYRWITYDSGFINQPKEKAEAEKALCLPSGSPEDSKSRPQRMLIFIRGNDDMAVFRRAIDHFSMKLTTLFVDCSDKYGVAIFDHLIAQASNLPCLRCLMLKAVDFRGTPLQSISSSFPKLTGLTLERGYFPHNPTDFLSLPQLESLYFDMRTLTGMDATRWKIPYLVRLSLPLSSNDEEKYAVVPFIQTHGKNLTFLHLNANVEITLPKELWTWCPNLTEIATCFSRLVLTGPISPKHPLTYLVHFLSDSNWRHAAFPPTSAEDCAKITQTIRLLPPGFTTFMVAITGWSDSKERRKPQRTMEEFWGRVYKACAEMNIRLEDERRRSYEECFLVDDL